MWYIIKYLVLTIIAIIVTVLATISGILQCIIWPILFFEIKEFWPMEPHEILYKFYSSFQDDIFPLFKKGVGHPVYNDYGDSWSRYKLTYINYYQYIWGKFKII